MTNKCFKRIGASLSLSIEYYQSPTRDIFYYYYTFKNCIFYQKEVKVIIEFSFKTFSLMVVHLAWQLNFSCILDFKTLLVVDVKMEHRMPKTIVGQITPTVPGVIPPASTSRQKKTSYSASIYNTQKTQEISISGRFSHLRP